MSDRLIAPLVSLPEKARQAMAWSVAGMSLSLAVAAHAQPVPSLNLRQFEPPADPSGGIYLEPTQSPKGGDWNVGVWSSYAYRSVVLQGPDQKVVAVPLGHQLSFDYLASVSLIDRLAVSLSVPTVVLQTGDDVTQRIPGSEPIAKTAMGDVAMGAKATIVPTREMGGFGVAVLARVTFPTGNARAYIGEGSTNGSLRVLAEYRVLGISVRATAGARVRGEERTYVGERFGHDLPWGVGISVRPKMFHIDDKDHWEWNAETHGAVALTPHWASGPQSPALVALSARYRFGDFSTLLGAELPGGAAVGVPSVRGIASFGWAPRFYDQDSDGIADDVDHCPEIAEDRDGFEDSDGCPDFDNDGDSVGDNEDRCPKELEDLDEFQDEDGCPDPDDDADGVLDAEDACPKEPGPKSHQGCPLRDSDQDGINDRDDQCPSRAEDQDGHDDQDGCPDSDNDGDGILDAEDVCPNAAGIARSDPNFHGCPSPDRDGDTFDDPVDACPEVPEDFEGILDHDGCPEPREPTPGLPAGARPLVTVDERTGGTPQIVWRIPPAFGPQKGAATVDPKTLPTVRALAQVLNQNPSWIMMVGVRPTRGDNDGEIEALDKSFALVAALRDFTHRDTAAESVGWAAVSALPGARQSGIGILVVPHGELASEQKSPQ